MNEPLCLIDTDIFSYILKRMEPAYHRSREYLRQHRHFTTSCLTYYECFRGYKAVGATKRLQVFEEYLMLTDVLYLDQPILDKAAEIYGVLKPKGIFPGEFDVLIGATALTHKMVVVTNNENHYEGMKRHFSLDVRNWMKKPENHEAENIIHYNHEEAEEQK